MFKQEKLAARGLDVAPVGKDPLPAAPKRHKCGDALSVANKVTGFRCFSERAGPIYDSEERSGYRVDRQKVNAEGSVILNIQFNGVDQGERSTVASVLVPSIYNVSSPTEDMKAELGHAINSAFHESFRTRRVESQTAVIDQFKIIGWYANRRE